MQILGTMAVSVLSVTRPISPGLVKVSGDCPCLVGKDWLQVIRLDWPSIAVVSQGASTRAVWAVHVLDNYIDFFTKGLGTIYLFKAILFVVKNANPRFHRA